MSEVLLGPQKIKHTFVVVLVKRDERSDIKHPECSTREQAEMILGVQLADMQDYMSKFYLTIEERWSL